MQAKSIKGKSSAEIQSALEQCMAEGFIPTLAVVFISVKQDSFRQSVEAGRALQSDLCGLCSHCPCRHDAGAGECGYLFGPSKCAD